MVETHAVGEGKPLVPRDRRFPVPRQTGASRGGGGGVANSRQVAALSEKRLQRERLDDEGVPRGKSDCGRNRGDAERVGEDGGGCEGSRGEGDGGRWREGVISRGENDGVGVRGEERERAGESLRGADLFPRGGVEGWESGEGERAGREGQREVV